MPKTCPEDLSLYYSHSMLLWSKSRNAGSVDKAKCQYGYVRAEYGIDHPFRVKCLQNDDPRYSPAWTTYPNPKQELRCVRKEPCTADRDCSSGAGAARREKCTAEGHCQVDCPGVRHGKIRFGSGEENEEELYNLGLKAKLICDLGYVVNEADTNSNEADVECVKHPIKGANWKLQQSHKNDSRAFCIRGCANDFVCLVSEICNVDRACEKIRCEAPDEDIFRGALIGGHGRVIRVGQEAKFTCDKGYLLKRLNGRKTRSVKLTCEPTARLFNSTRNYTWIIQETGKTLTPCIKGCIEDSDCDENKEFCSLKSGQCELIQCKCRSEKVGRIEGCLEEEGNAKLADETALKICPHSFVIREGNATATNHCMKKVSLICDAKSRDWRVEFTLDPVPNCVSGCESDADCDPTTGLGVCGDEDGGCQCDFNLCPELPADPHSTFKVLGKDRVIKTCNEDFAFKNETSVQGN